MHDRLDAVARLLHDEGYVDNEPDARLAAMLILTAAFDSEPVEGTSPVGTALDH